MKTMILLSLTVFSFVGSVALAQNSNSLENLEELCLLEQPSENSNFFKEIVKIDLKTTDSISDFYLKLVNFHLIKEQYTDKQLSLNEVKALFSPTGEQGYNDLYITKFISKNSGNIYVEVKSYPGDNPYSLIFNGHTGDVVASNEDDSITLTTNKGTVNCLDIQSNQ
ncbi:MAG: hypothetical protein ACXVCY_16955 [Pseudobdellovibrionaceae bacterium]